MIKLRKYLKPFFAGILAAIALLFVQAFCDLSLPNYMSDIVNVGIQQKGIESGAPEAVSADGFEFARIFMNDRQKALLSDSYTLVSATDTDPSGKLYSETYKSIGENGAYILNSGLSDETISEIENAFGTATLALINVMQSDEFGSAMSQNGGQSSPDGSMSLEDVDVAQMYAMKDFILSMPSEVIENAIADAANNSSLASQCAITITGAFYTELGVDMGAYEMNYIVKIGAVMLLIALIGGVSTVMVNFISTRIGTALARNLRKEIFSKVAGFSNSEFDKFSTASLVTRSTNDVMQIQVLLTMGIRMMFYAPIMGIGGIIMAVNKSLSMSWIIAIAVVSIVGLMLVIFSVTLPKFKSMQKLVDRLNLVARETLNGLMVVRAFGREDFEKNRFNKANDNLTDTNLFVSRVMAVMMPAMTLIMNGLSILIIWVGSKYIDRSALQVGDMMAYMQYAMHVVMSFMFISMIFIFVPRASVAAGRIYDVLSTEPKITNPESPAEFVPSKKGLVEIKNVSFKYDGADGYALENINFTAKPGQTTAIIGATGSGKSTLISLIPRFYDATEGEVLVNGVNVRDVNMKELRSKIGYVPQKSVLMTGNIATNIAYGDDNISEEQIKTAAKVAQAESFINEKPEGYEYEIAQGGSNVSGGQRQRLAIARALAINPDIFIFDDSFSALDFKTDAALRAALRQHTADGTVIIVAQRVSTIMNADRIYVIDNGRIVGEGTHKELLKNCREYYEIASSQLSQSEL